MTQENNQQIPDDYIPFGDEWKAYMMKLPKAKILDLYAQNRIAFTKELASRDAEIKRLRGALVKVLELGNNIEGEAIWDKFSAESHAKEIIGIISNALSPSVEQEGKEDQR